jgi:hypothetical protein
MKTSMNKRSHRRTSSVVMVGLAAVTFAFACGTGACELVTDFDRSLIPDAGSGDASDEDVQIPPFDFDAGDAGDAATLVPVDAGSDAGDATVDGATDAALDASDAADGDDASDASDAADAT